MVTGKNASILEAIRNSGLAAKHDITLTGWTDEMPALLAGHQVFIGKAGGAVVQEAIAAHCPLLVSHVVPGQEEGNITLIEQSGIGALAAGRPERVRDILAGAIANDGALWRAWRANLAALHKPSASRNIAKFLLTRIEK